MVMKIDGAEQWAFAIVDSPFSFKIIYFLEMPEIRRSTKSIGNEVSMNPTLYMQHTVCSFRLRTFEQKFMVSLF